MSIVCRITPKEKLLRSEGSRDAVRTLSSISLDAVTGVIAAAVGRVSDDDDGTATRLATSSGDWIAVKALLHVSLSDFCLDQIYSDLFMQDCRIPATVVRSASYRPELAEVDKSTTVNSGK
jgi:hypothetical protein